MALLGSTLLGVPSLASAATFYVNDWGTVKQGVIPPNHNGFLQSDYGWTVIANSQNGPFVNGSGEFVGTFSVGSPAVATDPANGLGLPANTAFFTAFSWRHQQATNEGSP